MIGSICFAKELSFDWHELNCVVEALCIITQIFFCILKIGEKVRFAAASGWLGNENGDE